MLPPPSPYHLPRVSKNKGGGRVGDKEVEEGGQEGRVGGGKSSCPLPVPKNTGQN